MLSGQRPVIVQPVVAQRRGSQVQRICKGQVPAIVCRLLTTTTKEYLAQHCTGISV